MDKLQALNTRWWQVSEDDELAQARLLFSTITLIKESQKANTLQDMVHMRMFGGRRAVAGMAFASAAIDQAGAGGIGAFGTIAQPYYNLIYSAVSTVTSKISKSKPRCEVLTDGGNYEQQAQAKDMQAFIDGLFYETAMYDHTVDALRNACIFGTGIVKLWFDDGELCASSVFPANLIVDTIDGDSQNPRTMYQDGLMDRYVLADAYKDDVQKYQAIMSAKAFVPQGGMASVIGTGVNFLNNMLLVNEGWHLPSGPEATDGRHVLALEGCLLESEPWQSQSFPFATIRFDVNPLGFWGRGIAELLTGHQLQLTRVLETEAMAHNLYSVPMTWIEASSNVNPLHLQTNYPGTIGYYTGVAPQQSMGPATSPDFIAYRDWIIQSAMQFLGLSEMNAQGTKPPGLNSGVAIREFADQVSDRWTTLGTDWETLHLDIARLALELIREEAPPSFSVRAVEKGITRMLKKSDAILKEGEYVIQCFPSSQLPRTPAARKQYVTELRQANAIDDDTMLDLLALPDIKSYMDNRNAPMEHLKCVITKITVDGEYTPPDELDNIALGIKLMSSAYLRGLDTKVPDAHLKLMRRWIAEAKVLMTPPPPPVAAPVPGAPGPGSPVGGPAPVAKGAPAPVADLLPVGAKGPGA